MKQYKVLVDYSFFGVTKTNECPYLPCNTPQEAVEQIKKIKEDLAEMADISIRVEILEELTEKEFSEEMEIRKLLEKHLQAFMDFQKETKKESYNDTVLR